MLHWLGLLLDNRAFVLTTPLEKEARRYIFQQYEQRRKDINKAQAEYVQFAEQQRRLKEAEGEKDIAGLLQWNKESKK